MGSVKIIYWYIYPIVQSIIKKIKEEYEIHFLCFHTHMVKRKMDARERFQKILKFEKKNDPFIWSSEAWLSAYERWQKEGMPVSSLEDPKEINMLFLGYGNQREVIQPNSCITGMGKCNNPPWVPPLDPMYELKTITEDEDTLTHVDYDGAIVKINKNEPAAMPQFIEYPVKDRASWDEYKKRLSPYSKGRFPKGWDIITEETCSQFPVKKELKGLSLNKRDFPIGMMALSLWGMPRNYLGYEAISYAMYDDPILVEDMIEYQTWFAEETIKQVFEAGIVVDYAFLWEDMCYKNGPLVSPEFVKNVMLPRYKKIIRLLRDNGVNMILLDSDGDIHSLLPIWLDAGVNTTYPLEAASGMDALALRKKYGKNLCIVGNVDKRALAEGKGVIDKEVLKVKELIREGGYFVNIDHAIPNDVPYKNYVYFLNEVNKLNEDQDFRRFIAME